MPTPEINFEAGVNGGTELSMAEPWIFEGGNQSSITMSKPYGEVSVMGVTPHVALTKVTVNAGQSLSTQAHDEKDELYYIADGDGEVQKRDRYGRVVIHRVKKGDVLHIPPGMIHKVTAGPVGLTILEASTCEVCNVMRISDPHNRPGSNPNYEHYVLEGNVPRTVLKCTPLSRPKLAWHKLSQSPLIPPVSDTLLLVSDSLVPDVTAHGCRT